MTLQITLSPTSELLLRERAAAEGKDPSTFAREAIEEKLASENGGLRTDDARQVERGAAAIRELLSSERCAERWRNLAPEQRARLERIRTLREAIGPVEFDVVEAVREYRENG